MRPGRSVKTLVVGDIHGCYSELQALLDRAGLTDGDAIIALGDIVDRGPETPQVLEFFQFQTYAISLLGNHERKHIRSFRGELQPALSQRISRQQLGENYPAAVGMMETFPLYLELPEAILVHGYLEPGVALDEQRHQVLCGTMGGDRYLRANLDRPWYELWDGDKAVIAGHLDYLRNGQPFVYQERVFGLDTGCVHGGRLTGLVMPDFRLVSVASRGDHWSELRRQYQSEKTARARKPRLRLDFAEPWDEDSERGLGLLMAFVAAENERILDRLQADPDYEQLTPRQRALAYAELVRGSPVERLLHLARRGELTREKCRRILGDVEQVEVMMGKLNL